MMLSSVRDRLPRLRDLDSVRPWRRLVLPLASDPYLHPARSCVGDAPSADQGRKKGALDWAENESLMKDQEPWLLRAKPMRMQSRVPTLTMLSLPERLDLLLLLLLFRN